MFRGRLASAIFALTSGPLAAAGALGACSETSATTVVRSADGSVIVPAPPPAPDASLGDRLATSTSVRFAHLSATLGSIDFCYRRTGTDQVVGPMMGPGDGGADAAALDGDADAAAPVDSGAGNGAGLARFGVTGYWVVEGSGTYRVDVVAAGSTSCANPIAWAEVTLEAGRYATLAVLGHAAGALRDGGDDAATDSGTDASSDAGNGSLTVTAFTDDLIVQAGKARVRLVHAALGDLAVSAAGAISVTAIDGARSTVLAPRIEPGRVSAPSTDIDARGYGSLAPLNDPQGFRVDELADAAGRSWSSGLSSLGLRAGSVHSGFVVTTGAALGVVWCDDTATGTSAACAWVAAQ